MAEFTDFAIPAAAALGAAALVGLAITAGVITAPAWLPVVAAIGVGIGVGLAIDHFHVKDNIFKLTPFLSRPSG